MDKPAFPFPSEAHGFTHLGLRRRELFVLTMAHGWRASERGMRMAQEQLAALAIDDADALIAALDAEPPK